MIMTNYVSSGLVSAGEVAISDSAYAPSGLVSAGKIDIDDPLRALFWHRQGGQKRPLVLRHSADGSGSTVEEERSALVVGEFFPDETTTGIYWDESELVVNSTENFRIETPGAHFENTHFKGSVAALAENITFRNCLFTGPFGKGGLAFNTNDNTVNVVLEDCTIQPRYVSPPKSSSNSSNDPSMVRGVTFKRCDMMGGVDALGVSMYSQGALQGRSDTKVLGCWLHKLIIYSPDYQQSGDGWSHCDVIQWHGGKGLEVRGSRLEGDIDATKGNATEPGVGSTHNSLVGRDDWAPGGQAYPSTLTGIRRPSSILMISPGNGTHGELIFESNWINHGLVGINAGGATLDFLTNDGSRIVNNKIGLDWWHTQNASGGFTVANSFGLLLRSAHQFSVSGNVLWNDNDPWDVSTPNNTRKNGG